MQRAAAAVLLMLAACSSFDAASADGAAATDAGAEAVAKPQDAATPADDAGKPSVCTPLVDEKFDSIALSGWATPRKTGAVNLGINNGTVAGQQGPALLTETAANPGAGVAAQSYLERVVEHVTTRAQIDYELAVGNLDPNAKLGCLFGPRQGLEYEAQIGLEAKPDGTSIVGSLQTRTASLPAGDATLTLGALPRNAWLSIHAEVALVDNRIRRALEVDGVRHDLPSFELPTGATTAFDGIHVACGLRDAYAPPTSGTTARALILMRNMRVTSCTP